MKYANLADIVNGFECAKNWKFVRKGKNDWSIVGLDGEGQVAYEIEHLHFKQCLELCADVSEKTEISTIDAPNKIVQRDPIVEVLNSCLHHLTEGAAGRSTRTKDTTINSVQELIKEITVGR